LLSHQRAPLGPALQDSAASAPYRTPLPLVEILLNPCAHQALNSEPTSGHSFQLYITNTLGIWSQAQFGSLVHSASPHRIACSVLSMLSALDCKSTVGHLLCSLSMLSALDCKPTVGHLLCSLSMLSALDNKPTVGHLLCSLSMISALDNKPTVGHSLVLFYLFSSFVSTLCFRHQSAYINGCIKGNSSPYDFTSSRNNK
jgi:hypothetical protein